MQHLLESDLAEVVSLLGDAGHAFAGKTVVMTGARGFLGRYFTEIFAHLNEHVLEKPCTFVGFDNLLTAGEIGSQTIERPNMRFIQADVIKPVEHEGPV